MLSILACTVCDYYVQCNATVILKRFSYTLLQFCLILFSTVLQCEVLQPNSILLACSTISRCTCDFVCYATIILKLFSYNNAAMLLLFSNVKFLQPNSILLAWPDDWSKNSDSGAAFVSIVKGAVQAHKAVMVRT
jgi:hypothetical protein